ncbi:MAG: hypothetical protein H9789_08040 [Candidatus Paraprevotella stercoravium]|jgi:hypothetical protein|uniref:Uncharacterized protein n=1 Tax=Candidatus Paraprevotella stercoravium TaxID=2838725 RepID=A0A9E2P1J8_9BACT|nr:hypothetical protein [Candidatus Paraprevotella stercoravium]
MEKQNQAKERKATFSPDYRKIAFMAKNIQVVAKKLQAEAEKAEPDFGKILSISNLQLAKLIVEINRSALLIPMEYID